MAVLLRHCRSATVNSIVSGSRRASPGTTTTGLWLVAFEVLAEVPENGRWLDSIGAEPKHNVLIGFGAAGVNPFDWAGMGIGRVAFRQGASDLLDPPATLTRS